MSKSISTSPRSADPYISLYISVQSVEVTVIWCLQMLLLIKIEVYWMF